MFKVSQNTVDLCVILTMQADAKYERHVLSYPATHSPTISLRGRHRHYLVYVRIKPRKCNTLFKVIYFKTAHMHYPKSEHYYVREFTPSATATFLVA